MDDNVPTDDCAPRPDPAERPPQALCRSRHGAGGGPAESRSPASTGGVESASDDADHRVGPCCYCALWHGGYWFPELTIEPEERYRSLGIVKKMLCQGVMRAELSCDPQRCVAALRGAQEPIALVRAT